MRNTSKKGEAVDPKFVKRVHLTLLRTSQEFRQGVCGGITACLAVLTGLDLWRGNFQPFVVVRFKY